MIQIDDIDTIILKAIIKDARSRLTDIAKICGISIVGIRNRIKRLKQKGLLIKASMNVNMTFFGYPYSVLIGVNVEVDKEQMVTRLIKEKTKLAGIDKTIGKYDLCLFVFAKSIDELNNLKHELNKLDGVRNIEINIWNNLQLDYSNIKIQSNGS